MLPACSLGKGSVQVRGRRAVGAAWVPPGGVGGSPALPEGAEIGLQGVCSRSGTRCHPGPTAGACQRLCCPFWLAGEGCAGLAQDLGSPWGGGTQVSAAVLGCPNPFARPSGNSRAITGIPAPLLPNPGPKTSAAGGSRSLSSLKSPRAPAPPRQRRHR